MTKVTNFTPRSHRLLISVGERTEIFIGILTIGGVITGGAVRAATGEIAAISATGIVIISLIKISRKER